MANPYELTPPELGPYDFLEPVRECVDRRLRTSEKFTRFQTDVLHLGNAVSYLSDPRIRGLTSIDQAMLENLTTPEGMVASVLLPAARKAVYPDQYKGISTFASRAGGLVKRWQEHDQNNRSNDLLSELLTAREVPPEDEFALRVAIAHTIPIPNLLNHLREYLPGKDEPTELDVKFMQRMTEALKIRMSSPEYNTKQTLEQVNTGLNESGLATAILTEFQDKNSPHIIKIKEDIAIASLTVAPDELVSRLHPETLIWALADPHLESMVAARATTELARRYNEYDNLVMDLVSRNISSLPMTPQTALIWRRLITGLTKVEDKVGLYAPVNRIAERIRDVLALPLSHTDANNLRPLMDGLSVLLHVPEDRMPPAGRLINSPLISEKDAAQLFVTLLQCYIKRDHSIHENGVRASLVNLAATLAYGYTRQLTQPGIVEHVNKARQKRDDDYSVRSRNLTPQGDEYNPFTRDYPNPPARSEGISVYIIANLVDYLTGSPEHHPV